MQRGRRHLRQFLTFGMVGGSGIVVNLVVTILLNKVVPHYEDVVVRIVGTPFNVRWYHLMQVAAFVVANTWNYELNRRITFKARGRGRRSWVRGLASFMGIGVVALLVGLAIQTVLLNRTSPFWLGHIGWMDDSSGFRRRLYWATLIQIALTMPINFIVNKLVTFRAVRGGHPEQAPLVAEVVAPEVADEVMQAELGAGREGR